MSTRLWVVEPSALKRLASDADRRAADRRADAETVRSAVSDHTMFGLYGQPLVGALRAFLGEHATLAQQCGRSWRSHAEAVRSHATDCARVEDEVVAVFTGLRARSTT
jgi:hypothetical protein